MDTKLKNERQKKGLTQAIIAQTLNTSERQYRRIELGKQKPSYDVLIKICKLFNINTTEIEQLFAVVDDAPNSK